MIGTDLLTYLSDEVDVWMFVWMMHVRSGGELSAVNCGRSSDTVVKGQSFQGNSTSFSQLDGQTHT